MPRRTNIDLLPEELKQWLLESIEKFRFASYDELAQELANRLAERNLSISISSSTLARCGKEYQQQLTELRKATRFTVMLKEEFGDDLEQGMAEALSQVLQGKLMNLLIDPSQELKFKQLIELVVAVTKLTNSNIKLKKFEQEVAAKIQDATEKAEQMMAKEGLSKDKIAEIKGNFLGIVSDG